MAGVVNCIPFLRKNSAKGQDPLPPLPPRLQRSASSSSKATTLRKDSGEKPPFVRNGSAPPSRTGTPLGSTPAIPPGFGWGKIIEEGKNLSVSTLGSYKGSGASSLSVDTELDFRPKRVSTTERLAALRKAMAEEPDGGLDYYIVPSEDAHQSEITADADKRREFISGFTGSAGVAIICRRESEGAHLFTDSRYFLQALRELDSNWSLHRVGLKGIKTWQEWLVDRPNGSRTGIDSRHISYETATSLQALLTARSSRLCYPRLNLIDGIWKDRPHKDRKPLFPHGTEFSGRSVKDKLGDLRAWIKSRQPAPQSASRSPSSSRSQTPKPSSPPSRPQAYPVGTLLSNLGQIAYILNLRGADVPYNPVFLSYLFISLTSAVLFVDKKKIDDQVAQYLKENDIETKEINDVWSFLRRAEWGSGKILIDSKTPYAVALMLTSTRYQLYPGPAFVEQYKAIKNDIEIRGFRNAYLRDGAAMVRFFAWLDEKMRNNEPVTEWGAAQRLSDFRRQNEYFICLAYENISATGGNAALPHYSPTRGTASFINTTTPYLNDSGGNYLDGTCDTTRTVHFGAPKQEQMEAFTRVLQGHIAIDSAIFPEGTTGQQLDVLARKALWKDGLNYMHGTGHGFGSFLNVHEGPHGFSSSFPLVPGHVITNEPGFYKDNEFGIRIESALLVKKVETKGKFGGSDWYGFERFTQVPIQTRMIRWDMLNHEEKDWIKAHNLQCLEKLAPLLQSDKRALKWLKRECTRGTSAGSAAGVSVEWD